MSAICKLKETDETRQFICCLCGGRYFKRYDVLDDFMRCVERNGNPTGMRWNDHPSCNGYKPKKNKMKAQTDESSYVKRADAEPGDEPSSHVAISRKRKRSTQ